MRGIMRRSFRIIGFIILMIILALTFRSWVGSLQALFAFLGANSNQIQTLTNVAQLLVWGGTVLGFIFGIKQRNKVPAVGSIKEWVQFAKTYSANESTRDFRKIEASLSKIEKTIYDAYHEAGLPNHVTNSTVANDLADLLIALADFLSKNSSTADSVKLLSMGYEISQLIDKPAYVSMFAFHLIPVYQARNDLEKVALWLDRYEESITKLDSKMRNKLRGHVEDLRGALAFAKNDFIGAKVFYEKARKEYHAINLTMSH